MTVDGVVPDVRDGLTPDSRRALQALRPGSAYRPAAHVVDDALRASGRDGRRRAVYRELVRMARDWEMRHPLVDAQGDLGSRDGDGAANADYTELKLTAAGAALLDGNGEGAAGAGDVLPARLPNLLVNGSFGAASPAASNIPPHNLREVVSALIATIEEPKIDTAGLMHHIAGPDWPTGGLVAGKELHGAYATGRGSIVVRARAEIDPWARAIVVTELPFGISKGGRGGVVAEIRRAARGRSGIATVDDQSSQSNGLRIVIELKPDAEPDDALEQLYAQTRLQTRFELNLVATVDKQARRLGFADLMRHYVAHRRDVVARRTALQSHDRVLDIVRADLLELAEQHGDERRTGIWSGA